MAYDFLCFSIPHVHGLKMNSYHQKYFKEKGKKQLVTTENKLEHVKTYSLTTEKEEDDDLVPGVPGTGIKIPFDSPSIGQVYSSHSSDHFHTTGEFY